MDIDLNVLNKITDTAVQAAEIRDYTISPLKKRLVKSDGSVVETDIDPPPKNNEFYTLEDIPRLLETSLHACEVFVGKQNITIVHDETRTKGRSFCKLTQSAAVKMILGKSLLDFCPEEFEKAAKLIFGADAAFINRLRKLQWKTAEEGKATISNVSKSMDVTALAKVIDENNILFEDVVLTVRTPWFVSPFKTAEVEIDLNIIANAANKTISFAPNPGVMDALELEAVREVFEDVIDICAPTFSGPVIIGEPVF